MTIVTLTTDFGLADGYVGIMKGVILGIAPEARLVDLSHEIAPQNVRQAAYILTRAAPFFPAGTVHLAVVDPGVGGGRRPLLVRTATAAYVGPDNGLFTAAMDQPGARAFALDRPDYWRPEVSRTFHGRDIFAPVAAHLARGVSAVELGRPVSDAMRLSLPEPERAAGGQIAGEVVYTDHFGNLITNIPGDWVPGHRWQVRIAERQLDGLRTTYAQGAPGELIALVSSGGTLEIAVREGSAAHRLGIGVGETVTLWPSDQA